MMEAAGRFRFSHGENAVEPCACVQLKELRLAIDRLALEEMLAPNPTNRLHCQHSPTARFESKRAAHQAGRGSILDADPPALECAPGVGQVEVSDSDCEITISIGPVQFAGGDFVWYSIRMLKSCGRRARRRWPDIRVAAVSRLRQSASRKSGRQNAGSLTNYPNPLRPRVAPPARWDF
jgi:hypothetical protein